MGIRPCVGGMLWLGRSHVVLHSTGQPPLARVKFRWWSALTCVLRVSRDRPRWPSNTVETCAPTGRAETSWMSRGQGTGSGTFFLKCNQSAFSHLLLSSGLNRSFTYLYLKKYHLFLGLVPFPTIWSLLVKTFHAYSFFSSSFPPTYSSSFPYRVESTI